MYKLLRRFLSDNRGGSDILETAFTFPLMLFISLALVTGGLFAVAANNANNAANFAARRASVEQANPAGVAFNAAWSKLNQASVGDYTVSVVASGQRGTLVEVRVGYSVPNFFAGIAAFFGAEMPAELSGTAVSFFRAEGW